MDSFDWQERIWLYVDGRLDSAKRSPATFPLPDGARLRATMQTYGMRLAHIRTADGTDIPLAPDSSTGECWRTEIDHRYPR